MQNFLATDSWLVRVLMLCALLSGIGALAGITVLLRSQSDFTFPLAAYPIVFPFLYYITHTSLRYRHPIDPVVLLLTAIAANAVWKFCARKLFGKPPASSFPTTNPSIDLPQPPQKV